MQNRPFKLSVTGFLLPTQQAEPVDRFNRLVFNMEQSGTIYQEGIELKREIAASTRI
ncbi:MULTISPECIES: hypothetical protein [Leptolyngbya]|nr:MULTISPECIES: hypothetical protein [Leptolyngbya]MBD2365458.1 hypothetical protein [Leptolyngbya sp. FACHB-161]MBD2371638.1 hypothetical protein [Leptolyngbya sp. FACHB-238]MBD2396063.1 hypothetical protein [Leptolyngbya sp. FACHB-239]MBD2402586.1 hypothetical protein [Leptolyngbya sp. FACHB-402]MCY6490667.1 hypothetical protein [Leptolyngbya sp. GGD]